jgi:hypothetical protein
MAQRHRPDSKGTNRVVVSAAGVMVAAVVLAGCGIHISKNGISGNIMGHHFSAEKNALPAGFPSDVPLPANSRVLGGGGAGDANGSGYEVGFAVAATVDQAFASYQNTFKNAGYTLSNVQAPESVTTPTGTSGSSGSSVTSTTVSLTGGAFTAANGSWNVEVVVGKSSEAFGGVLKAGETGISITVASRSLTTSTTS